MILGGELGSNLGGTTLQFLLGGETRSGHLIILLGFVVISKNFLRTRKIMLKTVETHQVMPKVKFSPPSKFKIQNKLKTALKMIK